MNVELWDVKGPVCFPIVKPGLSTHGRLGLNKQRFLPLAGNRCPGSWSPPALLGFYPRPGWRTRLSLQQGQAAPPCSHEVITGSSSRRVWAWDASAAPVASRGRPCARQDYTRGSCLSLASLPTFCPGLQDSQCPQQPLRAPNSNTYLYITVLTFLQRCWLGGVGDCPDRDKPEPLLSRSARVLTPHGTLRGSLVCKDTAVPELRRC